MILWGNLTPPLSFINEDNEECYLFHVILLVSYRAESMFPQSCFIIYSSPVTLTFSWHRPVSTSKKEHLIAPCLWCRRLITKCNFTWSSSWFLLLDSLTPIPHLKHKHMTVRKQILTDWVVGNKANFLSIRGSEESWVNTTLLLTSGKSWSKLTLFTFLFISLKERASILEEK